MLVGILWSFLLKIDFALKNTHIKFSEPTKHQTSLARFPITEIRNQTKKAPFPKKPTQQPSKNTKIKIYECTIATIVP